MASREELLQSIRPDMRLDKKFFMKIYGYELTWPGFAKIALDKLEEAGCSRAREYYQSITSEYEVRHEASLKETASWYAAELERKWKQEEKQKGSEEPREQKNNSSLMKRRERVRGLIERLKNQSNSTT